MDDSKMDDVHAGVFSDRDMPILKSLADLMHIHPHLTSCAHSSVQGSAKKPAAAASSNSFLSDAVRSATHQTAIASMEVASTIDPWQTDAYREARSKLATPAFFSSAAGAQELTQAQLVDRLRKKQSHLVPLSAAFESALLVESGEWASPHDNVVRTYPACMLGTQCIGHTQMLRNQDRPVVWTALMFPSEWDGFVAARVFTEEPRMCILDHRALLPRFICLRRLIRMKGSDPDADTAVECVEETPGEQLQAFYNLVDIDQGYFSKYVLFPEASEPMIQPIVRFNLSTVSVQALPSGQYRVDQSQMIYRGASQLSLAPTPRVGENVALF